MRRKLAIGFLACLCAGSGTVRGELFSIDLPEFQRLYGGFIGNTFQATAYDIGTALNSVSSVTLHLDGFTDIPNTTVTFSVELEGVATAPVDLLVNGPPLFPPYAIDIPLQFNAMVLDGNGPITLDINTSGPGADLSTTVLTARLGLVGVPIPEPVGLSLFLFAPLVARRTRRACGRVA